MITKDFNKWLQDYCNQNTNTNDLVFKGGLINNTLYLSVKPKKIAHQKKVKDCVCNQYLLTNNMTFDEFKEFAKNKFMILISKLFQRLDYRVKSAKDGYESEIYCNLINLLYNYKLVDIP